MNLICTKWMSKKRLYISNGAVATGGAAVVDEGCVLHDRHKIIAELVLPIVRKALHLMPSPHQLLMPSGSWYPPFVVHRTQRSTHNRHAVDLVLHIQRHRKPLCNELTTLNVVPFPTVLAITLNVVQWVVYFLAYAVVRHVLLTQHVSIISKMCEVRRKGLYW